MLCERCKIREANIQYTEVINGIKTEHNFCAQCAKEMDFGYYSAIFDSDFPLGKLLSGLLGMEEPIQKKEKYQQVVCPNCKTTYEEFISDSRFGCADCYGIFDLLIGDNMKKLQGTDNHKGKKPIDHANGERILDQQEASGLYKTVQDEIRSWELMLREAIRKEEYGTAAECRDKINELKERK